MIVWGGDFSPPRHNHLDFNTGGKYNPSTDSWTATSSTNAPSARESHTAIWTGSEMIVWGGFEYPSTFFNTGGRYNPNTDSWVATNTTNAPFPRFVHTAVWTGSEMIIWNGAAQRNDGGKYFPIANSWIAPSTANAPSARTQHSAVWTGDEMIVWGGAAFNGGITNTGGRYCAPTLPAQLGNISTRAFVQTGDNVMIGGFIVQGTAAKRVIIRAIGPELTQYGVPNVLANPTLELHNGTGALIASNDNWQQRSSAGLSPPIKSATSEASGYAPSDGLESAIIADLPPGNYTAIVRGVDNMTGVGSRRSVRS